VLNPYSTQSFREMPLFPAGHREDLSPRVGRAPQFFGPRQSERRARGMAMKLQRRFGAGLPVRESADLVAVTKENLAREAGPIDLPLLAPVQGQGG
jgi:hypothetical protein